MLGATGDELGDEVVRNVVVISVEAARRDVVDPGEGVQLVKALVADQVRPEPAVRGPERIVDEDGHDSIVEGDAQGCAFAEHRGIR